MEELSPPFVAPDGVEFEDWEEYQQYMESGYYQEDDEIPPYDASNRYIHSDDSDSENPNIAAYSLDDYIGDLKSKANVPRPQSAPAGARGKKQGEIVSETFTPNEKVGPQIQSNFEYEDNEVQISESVMIPSSPYDEEVAFEYRADDDEEIDSAYLDTRRGNTASPKSDHPDSLEDLQDRDWSEENRRFLMASEEANIPAAANVPNQSSARPRPSSADPRIRNNRVASSGYGLGRSSSSGRLGRSGLATGDRSRRSNTPTRARSIMRSSTEKLSAMKELVEDLVRNTVKKVDLYHMIQVSLGFIDDYLLIPPRGAIITGKKKTWLTTRDLQTAFISARLSLNEAQLIILRSLVHSFAQQYDSMYASTTAKAMSDAVDKSAEAPILQSLSTKKGVFGPAQTLSSSWLKKYLLHLRLSKKTTSNTGLTGVSTASSNALGGVGGAAPGGLAASTAASAEQDRPVAWGEWLGKKLQTELKRDSAKPKEFEKALNGQSHPLSKEDIELMLKTYNVLPAEILKQEVECKIESWLLDMDGRRDFQHALNVQIRRWIWNEKIQKKTAKIPKDEKGYWLIWQRLPEHEKKAIKENMLSTIIQEKRADLLSQERTKQTITKELFWKFDSERHKRECKWVNWLTDHVMKFKKDLEEFRSSEQHRLRRLAAQQSKKKTVAGLNEVQDKLRKAQTDHNMDSYHQLELQKAINALRRSALLRGVAKGTVITKEDFDKHIKGILAPYIMLDESGKAECNEVPRSAGPGRAPVQQSDIQGMFHKELKVAVDKVVELEKDRTAKSAQAYESWLADKVRAKEEQRQKKLEEEEAKKKEKALREKRNKKEYKKWCQLRRKDQYRSKVDNKPHPLPEARTMTHTDRWNSDKDLTERYAETEKKM